MSGRRERQRRRGQQAATRATLVRAGRAGWKDLAARVPWVPALRERKIALFGLGALGAPIAFEFARAGIGELRILDGDIIDPATVSRWPLGVACAGLPKVTTVEQSIGANWPWTVVRSEFRQLGRVRDPDKEPDGDWVILSRMLDDVDLVFDATAEFGVSYLLSTLARERSLTYVAATATHGARGGMVLAIDGNAEWCWSCFQAGLCDRSISKPPADPSSFVQPEGCAAPTFTGASFDLLPIVAEGVRTAVSRLTGTSAVGYPRLGWDVAVLSQRGEDGGAIPPTWRTYQLNTHPDCRAH